MEKNKPTKEEILIKWEEYAEELHGIRFRYKEIMRAFVADAMDEWAEIYHKEKLREELIRFTQPFYADEETCKHNVDEYLKQKG